MRKDNIVRVTLDGVFDGEFNIKTDLKVVSREEIENDENSKYLYIIKEGSVVIPSVFIKVDNMLYATNLDVCSILNEK